ncbi:response regulator transcription factor [Allobaculum stercoricanis]|uniref:response regulator transcription factor n=1 Tax=Allobaculum stercoricanis TaxID=174709 RepID=UPI002942F3EF|nr:response regulator transcription factor [Allobaculum stercoricanis]
MMKLIIADDQELLRESLKIVLSMDPEIEIIATCPDGKAVLDVMKREVADVILMDIRMPVMDGVYCTKLVKTDWPQTKVIILTTFDDDDFVFSALKYGASGYLLKGVGMDELIHAIKTVHSGGALINPNIASKVVSFFSEMGTPERFITVDESGKKEITATEWKVVSLIGLGLSNKEIASKLFLSEGTVRNYLSSILAKLMLRDRTQLAIWAVQSGVVHPEDIQ